MRIVLRMHACYERTRARRRRLNVDGRHNRELTTRTATPADAAAIAAIYNEGLADRVATFETEPRSAS
jgi:phosphinothricin acetyltransferase